MLKPASAELRTQAHYSVSFRIIRSGERILMRGRIAGVRIYFHGGIVTVTPASRGPVAPMPLLIFCCVHRSSDSRCFSMGRTTSKIAASLGASGPHLIRGSLGPCESDPQMASRSVQPFWHRVSV